ncbi:hypothetical protein Pmani_010710 [Petrolisthes manimaculis]|uniref:MADF domain-containing protein n=1 Tax=Petrolisthes manimaculis TaxID=1843537 RepID=A0AAE1Q0Y2_9EUCA|nr:hypothetical protein Pmani_010710 [Petrolisthes manimaculis]
MESEKKTAWDHAKDEMLIELVKTKPELYDLTSLRYSDNVAKRRSWVEVSRQLGCEVSKCKERWECLRSQYRKHIIKKTKSGQAAANSQKWKYEDQMSFLSAFMKDRTRVTSLQQAGNESEISDNAQHDGPQEVCSGQERKENDEAVGVAQVTLPQQERLTRKRKTQKINNSASATLMKYLIENKKEEQAPELIDTFFSLMATTVKKFSSADQHIIKTKVFSLLEKSHTSSVTGGKIATVVEGEEMMGPGHPRAERTGRVNTPVPRAEREQSK